MPDDFSHDDPFPPEDDSPQGADDVPRFLEDDELPRLETHPLFSNLPPRPKSEPLSTAPPSKPPDPAEQAEMLKDIDRFLEVTRGKRSEPAVPPSPSVSPLPPEPDLPLPADPEESVFADDALLARELEPEFTDEVLEEEDLLLDAAEAEEIPQMPMPGMPPPPPAPEIQSTFVNPALARVAVARPRRLVPEPSEFWLGLRTVIIVIFAALIVAFIFSYWTPDSFLSDEFVANLQEVSSTQGPPTAVPSPLPTFSSVQKVALITGHSGPPLNPAFTEDPGAICDENFDGVPELRELDLNTSVSYRVADLLIQQGFLVEMLNEWDPRLDNYRSDTLVSIHTNTCENLGFGATGFNVTAYERSPMIDRDNILVDCIAQAYSKYTGLPRHFGSPPDLVDYHAFRQVSVDTPTVIVELGFMFADRQVLTERTDDMARGIYEGIMCFLKPEALVAAPTPASP